MREKISACKGSLYKMGLRKVWPDITMTFAEEHYMFFVIASLSYLKVGFHLSIHECVCVCIHIQCNYLYKCVFVCLECVFENEKIDYFY